jgi:hypothetical protein
MIDREKVLAVLRRRFPGALEMDTAAAANAIVGLEDEWREVQCTDLRDSSIGSAKAASSGVSSASDLPIDPTNPRVPLLSAVIRPPISVELPTLRHWDC